MDWKRGKKVYNKDERRATTYMTCEDLSSSRGSVSFVDHLNTASSFSIVSVVHAGTEALCPRSVRPPNMFVRG